MNIPGYKIINEIGSGGMASVYSGIQESLQRKVAIKVMHNQLADQPHVQDIFEKESYVIAQLSHPNIIHVIDRGLMKNKTPYFVMEYLEGQDLAHLIQKGGLTFNFKLDLMIQVCKGLAYAHKNGVIHRDIKPANIFIDKENHAYVLDFGIAHFFDMDNQKQPEFILGTEAYMSPEQKQSSNNVTLLSDLYSLGVVMYIIFTGQYPKGQFAPPSALADNIPSALDHLILSCLDADPMNRPVSADAIKDSLLKLLQGTHLKGEQKQRASQGIASIKDRFALLDVIKDEKYLAIYLYENKQDGNLLVIKKRPVWSKGLEINSQLQQINHQNIARIYGTSKNDRMYIIVMEYLSGGALQERLIIPHDWDEALRLARQICMGLAYAHQHEIIHGNLTPSNILFDENGLIKLADFGLEEEGKHHKGYCLDSESKSKRTDIFSLGVILYQLLTGEMPSWKDRKIDSNDIFAKLPKDLQNMINKMVDWTPTGRYKSINEIIEQIDKLLEYHLQQSMLDAKSEQWMKRRSITKMIKKQQQEKRKKIITWVTLGAITTILVGAGYYYLNL